MSEAQPAAPPAEPTPPPAAPPAEPVVAAPPVDPAAGAAPPKTQAWVQPRIDQITREKHEALREAAALREENARLKGAAPAPAPANPAAPATEQQIRAAAAQLRELEKFDERCAMTYQAGKKDHPDFDQAVGNLKMLGGDTPQYAMLIQAVTNATDGHKVLHHLGNNMEEAQRLMSLPPIQMGIEMERVAARVKAMPRTSNAPAPIAPINGGGGAPVPGPDDNGNFKDQASFTAWRQANRGKK